MMRKLRQALGVSLVALLGVTGLVSCGGVGSDGNNNQGVVFTLLGFYSGAASDCGQLPDDVSGITGVSVPLSSSQSDGTPFPGSVTVAVGLQNNLSGQGISVDRLNLDYFIPGATLQPPSTIRPLPVLLGPVVADSNANTGNGANVPGNAGVGANVPPNAGIGAGSDVDTSLPPGAFAGIGSCSIAEFGLIPAQIRSWISLNRTSLPEAPFDLFVTVSAEGESTSGQRYTTNEETIVVLVTPDVSIAYAGGNATNVG